MLGGGQNPAVLSRRDGADDESSRCAVEGEGEEGHVVGGGGNHRGDGSDDAAMAGATGKGRLCRAVGSAEGKTECSAHPAGNGRGGARSLPRNVLRPEHPAFPREAAG